ncbi:hypothetical protein LVJ94_12165 [Pendulispora rubella]|uniref:PH domain-containing protein n=1 Tax=Pendulispora rubella TaxID=2741070 RepID=A0ABZ2LAP6_9BACT
METREHLEFYRVDQSGPTKRILIPALVLLTVGPPMVLFSAAVRKFPHSTAIGVLGAALMIAGLVIGFFGIGMLMFDDRYLAVVEGGLLVHLGNEETFFAWDSLEAIRHEGAVLVVVPRPLAVPEGGNSSATGMGPHAASGESLRFPLSKSKVAEIAARLEEWRRRDAWNLAPPPAP